MTGRSVSMLFLLLVCVTNSFAQANENADSITTQVITLQQAQEMAINNNVEVTNAALDIQIAKKKIWETTAIGLPQVTIDGTYTYNPEPAVMPMSGHYHDPATGVPVAFEEEIALGEESTATADLMVTQLVFSGEYIVGLKASKTYKRLSEESYENAKINMRENVASLYYAVLIIEENEHIIDSNIIALSTTYEEMQKLNDAGFVQESDVDQMKLNLQNLKNIKLSLSREQENLKRFFKYTIGVSLEDNVELADDLSSIVGNGELQASVEELTLENHIGYKMLQTNEDLMKLSMQQQKSKFLPTVSAFYKHKEYITEEPALSFEPVDLIGVSVSVPIFSSGMRLAKTAQARIEYDKAVNSKHQTSIALQLAAEKEQNNYNTAVEKFLIEKDNIKLAEKIFKQVLIKQKNGMASSIDVAVAQSQYLESQQKYFNAVHDLLNSKIAKDKALGKL